MEARYDTPSSAWFGTVAALARLDLRLHRVAARGLDTVELPGPVSFAVANPLAVELEAPGRAFRHVIGVVEGLSLVGQTSVPEVILDKVAAFRPFMRNSVFWGAYGPRAAGSVGLVVDLLRRDPDSRQATITLFDSQRDLGRSEQVDLPCTLSLSYQVRGGALNAWTVMRSNDAWLGLPYDLMQFGMLQGAVAQALGLRCGFQAHSAFSMHLYFRDLQRQEAVLKPAAGAGARFGRRLWGASDVDAIASRARRLLVGQGASLAAPTDFERWCAALLAAPGKAP